jgi:ribonuclease G
MAKNLVVINVDIRETRVALIENGVIAEFHIERAHQARCLGDVVLGKVTRVLPGMQAAFIDVGLEKAAFLHVEDLIRPDDFESYLAGHRRFEEELAAESASVANKHLETGGELDVNGTPLPPPVRSHHLHASPSRSRPGVVDEDGRMVASPNSSDGRLRLGRMARRRNRRTIQPPAGTSSLAANSPPKYEFGRIDKNTPIREVIREGQEALVQISKEPIGTKGARVTSHISLPGRYVVYMPTVDYIGISKRIGSEKERSRLRESIESMKPPTGGLIVRTVAEGLTKKQLKADVGYLVRLWGEIIRKRAGAKSPCLLYSELDLVLKVARDMFTEDVAKIVIDDKAQYERLVRFIEMFMPERVGDIELYQGEEPVFDEYGIEEEIKRALSRKVPLPSGGYLIIDEAEALTAIDVNTGRFVGKGSRDHEETIIKTNLEAVEEIAYQLRFRNLGGLIVLDLIDMERPSSREKVRKKLEEMLQKDKAKTSLNRISELGLIEMTRKRTRESLGRALHEPCPYCDGTGQVRSKTTIVYEILRSIHRERANLRGYQVTVKAHPEIVSIMRGEERDAVAEAERRFRRRIELEAHTEYHVEQFDLVSKE